VILCLYLKNIKSGSLDTLTPKSLSEWAVFVPNDDLLQTFTLPQAKQRGFNKNTISKPVRKSFHSNKKRSISIFLI